MIDALRTTATTTMVMFVFCLPAHAARVASVSCTREHVVAAIQSATSGDTVTVPAGTCTWDTSPIVVPDTKRLIIEGAGVGLTNITVAVTNALFLGLSDSDVTGFSFTTNALQVISARGHGGWRVHHNSFVNVSTSNVSCIYASGATGIPHPIGLIDNNTFQNCRPLLIQGDLALTRGLIYAEPTGWGTFNSIYVEDNTLTYSQFGNGVDAQYSGRYVFRFNRVVGAPTEVHSTLQGFGGRSWEIYGNDYVFRGADQFQATYLRGGTGILFMNIFDPAIPAKIFIDNVRSTDTQGTWGKCDGTNPRDGNLGGNASYPNKARGWPCLGQIGRGQHAALFVDGSVYPTQASEPSPIFLNRADGIPVSVLIATGSQGHISDCTDIQIERSPFNGTCGTGVGLAVNRPATCVTGVYFWATDEGEWNARHSGPDGQLYKCTAPNNWSMYYKPYPYPHPLANNGPTVPQAPHSLRIVN